MQWVQNMQFKKMTPHDAVDHVLKMYFSTVYFESLEQAMSSYKRQLEYASTVAESIVKAFDENSQLDWTSLLHNERYEVVLLDDSIDENSGINQHRKYLEKLLLPLALKYENTEP